MTTVWSAAELERIDSAEELRIATERADGTWRPVKDIGDGAPDLRAGIDAAYRAKYGRYGAATVDRMVSADAHSGPRARPPHMRPGAAPPPSGHP